MYEKKIWFVHKEGRGIRRFYVQLRTPFDGVHIAAKIMYQVNVFFIIFYMHAKRLTPLFLLTSKYLDPSLLYTYFNLLNILIYYSYDLMLSSTKKSTNTSHISTYFPPPF